jgi:hypothetical protein
MSERARPACLADLADLDEGGEVVLDARPAGQLENAARLEVEEEQACLRMAEEVAERVEHAVAGVVVEGETVFAQDTDEAGTAPPVRGVGPALGMEAGDEERVRARDCRLLILVQRH